MNEYYEHEKCDVPECDGGFVRLPVIRREVSCGYEERFVRFEYVACGECRGIGRKRITS